MELLEENKKKKEGKGKRIVAISIVVLVIALIILITVIVAMQQTIDEQLKINVNGKQHAATAHYLINYGYIPLWVVVKVLSFGIVGELYTVLQYQDQLEIAQAFNIDVYSMIEYLPILANYRNLCAHEDICYCNKIQKSIEDTKYHKLLYITKSEGEYIYGKNDLFALIIILKSILNNDDFTLFMNEISYEIDRLEGKLKVIRIEKVLHEMGLPNNYKEIVRLD